jgi:mRNA interferase MazF
VVEEKAKKDFNNWTKRKGELEFSDINTLFHEREVWWCALGLNIGSEQDGKNELFERPVLIIKKYYSGILTVLPITSLKKDNPYYINIEVNRIQRCVILSQIRTISSKRLIRKMGMISTKEYNTVLFRLIKMLL